MYSKTLVLVVKRVNLILPSTHLLVCRAGAVLFPISPRPLLAPVVSRALSTLPSPDLPQRKIVLSVPQESIVL